jgi:hypothetical protein
MLITVTWFDVRKPDVDLVAECFWRKDPENQWHSDPNSPFGGLVVWLFGGSWTFRHSDAGLDQMMASQGGSRGGGTRSQAMQQAMLRLHTAQQELKDQHT